MLLQEQYPEKNIRVTKYCTTLSSYLFFYHWKREGKTGRMMSFTAWKEDK